MGQDFMLSRGSAWLVGWCWRVVVGLGALGKDLVWCLDVPRALLLLVDTARQLFEGDASRAVDPEHLTADPPVEPLDHPISSECRRFDVAMLRPKCSPSVGAGLCGTAAG